VAFLVAPKFLAMLVMVPCLTIWADFMGVMGGCLFGAAGANFTFTSYLQATRDALVLRDIFTGLVKSALFSLVITAVGCQEGFSTGAGAEEVGRSTTSAVVTSIFMVILGGSGSGKSTLLRTLVGLERPSGGEAWIKGVNIAQASDDELDEIRKKMGVSFQGGALFGSMTVGENVALPLREHTRLEESTIEIMVRIKLEQVGLASFEDFMPSQLSGGMKKRAAVARALAMDPEILFF